MVSSPGSRFLPAQATGNRFPQAKSDRSRWLTAPQRCPPDLLATSSASYTSAARMSGTYPLCATLAKFANHCRHFITCFALPGVRVDPPPPVRHRDVVSRGIVVLEPDGGRRSARRDRRPDRRRRRARPQASIIMIANSPSAASWPYALHRVTPFGSEDTSMPSVPASDTCSKRNFGAAGNPLRQTPVSSTSASASAAAACAGSLLSRISVLTSAATNSMIGVACEAASVPRNSAFHWRLVLQRRQVRVVITGPHTYPAINRPALH